MEKKTRKPKIVREPLPKEGSFWKYLFWFMSNFRNEFIGIVVIIFIIIFILSSDIGFFQDTRGDLHFTFSKKATHVKLLNAEAVPVTEKTK